MQDNFNHKIQPKNRNLYFNEEQHKYTDELGTNYISVTTLINKYINEFKVEKVAEACERIGKNPNHHKYLIYAGKSKKQILQEWKQINKDACEKGTKKHNYLENIIRKSTNYNATELGFINDKLYTIDDIIKSHNFGKLNMSYFKRCGLEEKYPKIFELLKSFNEIGYNIYSEIGVYNFEKGISGLIDILLINKDNFIILDWKTNRAPLQFKSGYYRKNPDGTLTDDFIEKFDVLSYPLEHIADSVGEHYTLQLSLYAYLVEQFGFKNKGLILSHIRTLENTDEDIVELYNIKYRKDDIIAMINDYTSNNLTETNILF